MSGTKQGAAKRRQSIIDNRFNGDVDAYNEWQRKNASQGGKKGGPLSSGNFKNIDPRKHKKISAKGGKASIKAHKDMPDSVGILGIEHSNNSIKGGK